MIPERWMIAISFAAGNSANAMRSLRLWGDSVRRSAGSGPGSADLQVCFGAEVSGDRDEDGLRAALSAARGELRDFRFLDDRHKRRLAAGRRPDLPRPVSSAFSFASGRNLATMLAVSAGADFLLTVDPGTQPPPDVPFAELIGPLRTAFRSRPELILASGQYSSQPVSPEFPHGRPAFRLEYFRPGAVPFVFDLVRRYVGVDPAGQLTAGALARRLAGCGVPAAPMEPYGTDGRGSPRPTLAWHIDDGAFEKSLRAEQWTVFPEVRLHRFAAASMPRPALDHFRTLAGAVFWTAVHDRRQGRTDAERAAGDFIRELNCARCLDPGAPANAALVGASGLPELPPDIAPREYLDRIEEASRNYGALKERWREVVEDSLRAMGGDDGGE